MFPVILALSSSIKIRHWIMETAELNQPIYFKNVLTSKRKLENMLHLERGYAFASTGNEKLFFSSKLIKIRFA